MDDRGRRQQAQTYDLGVGFFGFFAVAFFVISLLLQISGQDPLWASFSALAAFLIVGVIWLFRRRFLSRSASGEGD